MTKSELIERIAAIQTQLSAKDLELAVKMMLDHMANALATGERIEIRGFGTLAKKINKAKFVRNPKTNEKIYKDEKSFGVTVIFQPKEKSFSEKNLDEFSKNIISIISNKFGGYLRD